MNLTEIVKKLGDKNYSIGSPAYVSVCDDEHHETEVHAVPIRESGKGNLIKKIISSRDNTTKGIAIAYGGFLGIDIALAHDAEGVLLLDINPEQKKFWKNFEKLIKECPDLASFKERFSIISSWLGIRGIPGGDEEEVYPSFTRDEALYQRVRAWAINGMIASTDMDVRDTSRHNELSSLLNSLNMNVKVIYLSNIPHFYNISELDRSGAGRQDFYSSPVKETDYKLIFNNQRILASEKTTVVQAILEKNAINFELVQAKLGELTPGNAPRR